MVVLSPDGKAVVRELAAKGKASGAEEDILARGVASYQCASDLYAEKRLTEVAVAGSSGVREGASSNISDRVRAFTEVSGDCSASRHDDEAALLMYMKFLKAGLIGLH